jgi:hypothetical protein
MRSLRQALEDYLRVRRRLGFKLGSDQRPLEDRGRQQHMGDSRNRGKGGPSPGPAMAAGGHRPDNRKARN